MSQNQEKSTSHKTCLACHQSVVDECFVSNDTGYHYFCLPCKRCGQSIVNNFYVDEETGYHEHCLPAEFLCLPSII